MMRRRWRQPGFIAGVIATSALASGGAAAGLDADVIANAKKEGEVVFYTNLIVNQIVRPLASSFEKKYGIKVEFIRADSQATILKVVNEFRAGKIQADVWNLSSGLDSLTDAGVIVKFKAPNADGYPSQYRDPNGTWVATNVYVNTPGYNTDLVPANAVPKTYQALLDPRWKGKLVWKPNDISGAVGFIGNILTAWGEQEGMDYLRKLAGQDINTVDASARAIVDRVIAGDYPIALQIFNHHTVISQEKGAPVSWIAMEPATVSLQIAGITNGAPHPNAALLFVDYMISAEGQQAFQQAGYLPADSNVPAQVPALKPEGGGFKGNVLGPEEINAGLDHWTAVFKQLFH